MTARSTSRRFGVAAAAAVLALLAVACGSDGPSPAATAPTQPAPTGPPIKVLVIAPTKTQVANFPDIPAAAEAAAAAVNARGGVGRDGRPLEIVYCNDQFSPNGAGACAAEATKEGVVALVGGFSSFGSVIFPVLERAGIPAVGWWPSVQADFVSPNAFLLGGGTLGGYVGQAKAAKDAGKKNIATLSASSTSPTGDRVAAGAGVYGLDYAGTILTPPTTKDYAPVVADLQRRRAEAVSLAVGGVQAVQIIQAASQLGYDPLWLNADGNMTLDNLQTLGPLAKGITFVGSLPPASRTSSSSAVRRMLSEYGARAKAAPLGATGTMTWLAVEAFVEISKDLARVDAPAMLTAVQAATAVDLFDIVPAWTPGVAGPVGAFPRLTNPFLYISRWDGSSLEQVGTKPFDATRAFQKVAA